jgi:hypothetical protein
LGILKENNFSAYTLSHPEIVSCATLAAVLDPVARYGLEEINYGKKTE